MAQFRPRAPWRSREKGGEGRGLVLPMTNARMGFAASRPSPAPIPCNGGTKGAALGPPDALATVRTRAGRKRERGTPQEERRWADGEKLENGYRQPQPQPRRPLVREEEEEEEEEKEEGRGGQSKGMRASRRADNPSRCQLQSQLQRADHAGTRCPFLVLLQQTFWSASSQCCPPRLRRLLAARAPPLARPPEQGELAFVTFSPAARS